MIGDKFELSARTSAITSTNLITYCKVTEVKAGLLKLEGDGFTINMAYDSKKLIPKIEFIEVKDRSLKRYWPAGVTRIRLEFKTSALKGETSIVFTPAG